MSRDLNQITTTLESRFNEEGQSIVFWNDPENEFQATLPSFNMDDVKVTYGKFGDLLAEAKAITGGKDDE